MSLIRCRSAMTWYHVWAPYGSARRTFSFFFVVVSAIPCSVSFISLDVAISDVIGICGYWCRASRALPLHLLSTRTFFVQAGRQRGVSSAPLVPRRTRRLERGVCHGAQGESRFSFQTIVLLICFGLVDMSDLSLGMP